MILTVTLNAAVDRTYRVDGFRLDAVNRPTESRVVAGGKGVNVARTVLRLGGAAMATGILGGRNGRFIAASLRLEGIRGSFVWVRGESRTCIAAVDPSRRSQTEINEVGPEVSLRAMRRLLRLTSRLFRSETLSFVTMSGSIPPGMPADVYRLLIEEARRWGIRSVLDSSGEPLRQGALAEPWMLKPNLLELEHLTGERPNRPCDVAEVAARLVQGMTQVAVVTMGAAGCVCVTNTERFMVRAPEVPFVSAVGSGDAMLGAMLLALRRGRTWRDAVAIGVGAGAANACEYGAAFVSPEAVENLAAVASVEDL